MTSPLGSPEIDALPEKILRNIDGLPDSRIASCLDANFAYRAAASVEELRALCALARQGIEARKDGERLDWLEAEANKDALLLHDGTYDSRYDTRTRYRGLGLRPGMLVRTLREAIDAARSPLSENSRHE